MVRETKQTVRLSFDNTKHRKLKPGVLVTLVALYQVGFGLPLKIILADLHLSH